MGVLLQAEITDVAEQFQAYGPFAYALVVLVGGILVAGFAMLKVEWNRKNRELEEARDKIQQAHESALKHQETTLKALNEIVMVVQTFKQESGMRDDSHKQTLEALEQRLVQAINELKSEMKQEISSLRRQR
jgi:NaMN:DMB phosphoribosyltransferase